MNSGLDLQPVVWPDRVVVLATDSSLVQTVRLALGAARFQVHQAADTGSAAALLREWHPDVAIVDFDLDQGAMLDWLTSAPPPTGALSVIALTQIADLPHRVAAFERGADDVLVGPLSDEELLARTAALIRRIRRSSMVPPSVLKTGELEIDLVRRTTTLSGVDIALTPVEQSLFYLLAINAGKVLSRDAILTLLYGPEYSSESNIVDRHIRNLRTKLRDDFRHPRFIATVAGRGYRFVWATTALEQRAPRRSRLVGSDPPPRSGPSARTRINDEPTRIHPDWCLAARTTSRRLHRLRPRLSRRGLIALKRGSPEAMRVPLGQGG